MNSQGNVRMSTSDSNESIKVIRCKKNEYDVTKLTQEGFSAQCNDMMIVESEDEFRSRSERSADEVHAYVGVFTEGNAQGFAVVYANSDSWVFDVHWETFYKKKNNDVSKWAPYIRGYSQAMINILLTDIGHLYLYSDTFVSPHNDYGNYKKEAEAFFLFAWWSHVENMDIKFCNGSDSNLTFLANILAEKAVKNRLNYHR